MSKTTINNAVLISNMVSFDHVINNKITKSFQKSENIMYGFLNYDKNYLSMNDLQTGVFKSVIFSYPQRKILSFCPAKSISYQYFREIFPTMNKDIQISSYNDGCIIQLFYDSRIEKWKIATKYYMDGLEVINKDSKKNVYQAFVSCFQKREDELLENIDFIQNLPQTCNYVFSLSNENKENKLYLNSVFQVQCDLPNSIKYVPEFEYKQWDCFQDINIHFSSSHYFESYDDLNEYLKYIHEPVKLVLTNTKTGLRTKVQTDEQIFLKRSSITPNFEKYLFFCLYRIHNDYKIYELYPQYYKEMWNMKILFESMIDNVHQMYVDYFIQKRSLELKEPFKKYLLDIHKHIYLPSLKNRSPVIVKRSMIKTYFSELSPNELTNIFIDL
jgi:hypothetical protein